MIENNIDVRDIEDKINEFADEGKTPLIFAKNDHVIGIIACLDTIKESSKEAIKKLQKQGIKVVMVTGDHLKSATAIQKMVGVDEVIAQVLPSEKADVVRKYQKDGLVAMVGDGINDALALTSSDVGIAIGAGSDIALESAQIVLMKDDLLDVSNMFKLSSATMTNIKQNLFWAFFYNAILIPLAAGVLYTRFGLKLNPMIAAGAMSLSSFSVVSNALRLKRFKFEHSNKQENKIEKQEIKIESREVKMNQKVMKIEGMMCKHCVAHVKRALESIEGVSAEVSLERNEAVVTSVNELNEEVLRSVVEKEDYKVISIN